jgi:hypothetical protein
MADSVAGVAPREISPPMSALAMFPAPMKVMRGAVAKELDVMKAPRYDE